MDSIVIGLSRKLFSLALSSTPLLSSPFPLLVVVDDVVQGHRPVGPLDCQADTAVQVQRIQVQSDN